MQISHDNIIWMFREYYIFVTVLLTARQNGVFRQSDGGPQRQANSKTSCH